MPAPPVPGCGDKRGAGVVAGPGWVHAVIGRREPAGLAQHGRGAGTADCTLLSAHCHSILSENTHIGLVLHFNIYLPE